MHSVWVLIEMNALDNTSKSRPGSGGAKKISSPPLNPFVVKRSCSEDVCPLSPSRRAAARKTSKGNLGRLPLALLELLLWKSSAKPVLWVGGRCPAYQSLGGAVERMPVVSPELGVGAVQRGVALGLGLLDAVAVSLLASSSSAVVVVVVGGALPVPVRLARLVVLGRVLGLWGKMSVPSARAVREISSGIRRHILAIVKVFGSGDDERV